MIRMVNVRFSYRGGPAVIDSGELEIRPGLTLLLGPNGCGKTTLLKLLAGVEKPSSGRVFLEELDLWQDEVASRRRLAYVPEHPDLTPYATVEEILELVCRLRHEPSSRAVEILERVGLGNLGHRSVRELSQGQRRRAVLAAAWIGQPRVLLLDEPFEAMDRNIHSEVLTWIETKVDEGAAAMLGTHEFEEVAHLASAAITVGKAGKVRLYAELPDHRRQRMDFLENLARGGTKV